MHTLMHFVKSGVQKDPMDQWTQWVMLTVSEHMKNYKNHLRQQKNTLQHGSIILVSAHLDGRREKVRSIRFGLRQMAIQCLNMAII